MDTEAIRRAWLSPSEALAYEQLYQPAKKKSKATYCTDREISFGELLSQAVNGLVRFGVLLCEAGAVAKEPRLLSTHEEDEGELEFGFLHPLDQHAFFKQADDLCWKGKDFEDCTALLQRLIEPRTADPMLWQPPIRRSALGQLQERALSSPLKLRLRDLRVPAWELDRYHRDHWTNHSHPPVWRAWQGMHKNRADHWLVLLATLLDDKAWMGLAEAELPTAVLNRLASIQGVDLGPYRDDIAKLLSLARHRLEQSHTKSSSCRSGRADPQIPQIPLVREHVLAALCYCLAASRFTSAKGLSALANAVIHGTAAGSLAGGADYDPDQSGLERRFRFGCQALKALRYHSRSG